MCALGALALLAPLGDAEEPMHRVGALLVVGGALGVLHGIRRADSAALRRAVAAGVISILMGMLVLLAPYTTALVPLLALAFALVAAPAFVDNGRDSLFTDAFDGSEAKPDGRDFRSGAGLQPVVCR